MILRPAEPRDCAAICAFWNPMIRESEVTFNSVTKSTEDLAAMIANRNADGFCFLVAEVDGEVLGFATYSQFRGGIGYARTMEHTVILHPKAQGRGIGRALMAAVEDHARAGGAHSIFAGVSSGNPAGVGFHAALGYEHVSTLKEVGYKFDRWFDLHLMQKRL